MIPEASLASVDGGREPRGEGWFVLNARDAVWREEPSLGRYCRFEGDVRFTQFGVSIHILMPGQPNCMFHGEDTQEDFLVLSGECLLLVEGEERRLQEWDFVHCPAWTEHVFVGTGDGPCALLMMGARPGEAVRYPVSDLALRHRAGVDEETDSPKEAYARFEPLVVMPYREGDLP
jgi:uncharacterized cupin superfamily protein